MQNVTTATAITSNGQPQPAGLSTGDNSTQLQATLPVGSSIFSNPLMFNNIFWDNRAGTKGVNTVLGIGSAGDATPINNWDMGVVGSPSSLLAPTNSVLHVGTGITASPTNRVGIDPAVIETHNIPMTFTSWRTNVNFIGAIMVTADLNPALMGNFHLQTGTGPAFPAVNLGAASKLSINAPAFDIDNQARPALGGYDSGADEIPGLTADFGITKTDGVTSVNPGDSLTYTITASNAGPDNASAAVTDNFPAAVTVNSWTCTASAGSSCTTAGSGNNRTGTVTLLNGGSATYTATVTAAVNATGSVINTATIAASGTASDPVAGNNSATDTDTVNVPANKHIGDLDRASIVIGSLPWSATVTITVHNSAHNPVSNATVTGSWSGGGSGGTSCTTNANGQCTVLRLAIPFAQTSNTFTVTNITGASGSGSYVSGNNHDPDSGTQASNGTTITVPR
jgi:uncharacterized repeat protein (TIGR01451 family)